MGGVFRWSYWGILGLLVLTGCSPGSNPYSYSDKRLQEFQDRIAAEMAKPKPDLEKVRHDQELLHSKRTQNSLAAQNMRLLSERMSPQTDLHNLKGLYRVLVIPVEFQDVKFDRPSYFQANSSGESPAQAALFGSEAGSMRSYYRHVSFGQLDVTGEVVAPVQVQRPLVEYGEALGGSQTDKDARGLVRDALVELMKRETRETWWESFDNWDLSDYDGDTVFSESDGFIDAVVLIYAGKDQASCQRIFDPKGERPASASVPAGPRQKAAVECFNRIWPHRSAITIAANDPLSSSVGPKLEGVQRPSFFGLKITDRVFALDYNMQSEFSERSTIMHEFGHSLTLPDVYASEGENSTGSWELMSSNAPLEAQELSSYSKLTLGWLLPKVFQSGQESSFYLGAYNFVSSTQRDPHSDILSPHEVEEVSPTGGQKVSILSTVPSTGESVYRSAIVLTPPTEERKTLLKLRPEHGTRTAYSGLFDGQSKSMKFKVNVPRGAAGKLELDLNWAIETENSFDSDAEVPGMIGDFDIGEILVGGKVVDTLRFFSGDENQDTLVEANPACQVQRVLELRKKRIAKTWSAQEKEEYLELLPVCRESVWVKKAFDVSAYQGTGVEVEVRYTTDPGYNELGIFMDNLTLDGALIEGFESSQSYGGFKVIENGEETALYNQFYLMEYRTPGESYTYQGQELSYNKDNNIVAPTQAMFLPGDASPIDRVRFVEFSYQPGVVVWYYNSKFSRTENSPEELEGKGYLLVVNPAVKDLRLPGPLGDASLLTEAGDYKTDAEIETLLKPMRDEFVCFGYTKYASFVEGVAPSCSGYQWLDALQGIQWDGQLLKYRRELINDVLPIERSAYRSVEIPYRNNAQMRAGLAVFRPEQAEAMAPTRVFKVQDQKVVEDPQYSGQNFTYPSVSKFQDKESVLPKNPRLQSDTVVVEKRGFGFKVVAPDTRVINQYKMSSDADDNAQFYRRPRAKVILNWE